MEPSASSKIGGELIFLKLFEAIFLNLFDIALLINYFEDDFLLT